MGFFGFITAPTSYQNAQTVGSLARRDQISLASTAVTVLAEKLPPHSQHPNFGHLTLLVFEAVLEVVCVSLPGYIIARQGFFDAESQKFLANLNVALFTPCLSIASRVSNPLSS
jgi:auxin efflux carrier family protein